MLDSDDDSEDVILKIVVVGDGASGKTSLITRYTQNWFAKSYDQTVGLDFFLKRVNVAVNKNVTLKIWDIGGQTLCGNMFDKYIYGAHGVIFVYDVTNHHSFENVEDWLLAVKSVPQATPPRYVLVANKSDLEHLRMVTKDRHLAYAKKNGLASHFVSAKTGESVPVCFKALAADILDIKLSRIQTEQAHRVVAAEIDRSTSNTTSAVVGISNKQKSALCSLQ